jgi:hypothetical protein
MIAVRSALSRKGGEKMVEKITKVMVTLIFAVAGFFLMRILTPPLVAYLGWDIIKEGVIGFTILDFTLGLVGVVYFGYGWLGDDSFSFKQDLDSFRKNCRYAFQFAYF